MVKNRYRESFEYNGKTIKGEVENQWENGVELWSYAIFPYGNLIVKKKFYEDKNEFFRDIAIEECKIIDKIGEKNYAIFSDNVSRMESIKKEYIVINDKVFDYSISSEPVGNEQYFYVLAMDMTDGKNLGGESFFTHFRDKDKFNKRKSLENLRSRVENYFKKTGVEPDEKHLKVDVNEEYQDKLNWNKRILMS